MSKEHVNLILIGWALVVCGENFENTREINQTNLTFTIFNNLNPRTFINPKENERDLLKFIIWKGFSPFLAMFARFFSLISLACVFLRESLLQSFILWNTKVI